MERFILSLDIGSSSCKAVVFDERGVERASGRGDYPVYYSADHIQVEQAPEEIWQGVCKAILQLSESSLDMNKICALSLSSQISSHFLVDIFNRPLTNIITWMDSRAHRESEEMRQAFSSEQLTELLGAELPAGASWPIPKLRWLAKKRPEWLERAKYIVQPKDWILWKLTSVWKTDLSSLRGLAHQSSGEICKRLLDWACASPDLVPTWDHPYGVGGRLLKEAAQKFQLPMNLPVMVGWNDFNAAVLGSVGLESKIQGFDVTGTSEHVGIILSTEKEAPILPSDKGINQIPFLKNKMMSYGVTSSGGQAFKWYVEKVDQVDQKALDYSKVIGQATRVPAGSDGVLFLPYINGERSPWWNPSARGVFFGLHSNHNRHVLSRSVLEGVCYALRTIYDRLGNQPETIRVTGGLSRIPFWNQMKADVLGVPLVEVETSEAGCLGAAILAAYGLGWYPSLEEACQSMILTGSVIEPSPKNHSIYQEQYARFLELYKTIEPLFVRQ